MSSFRVPRRYQQKVLLVGITVALALRTGLIFAGAALIENVTWIFYLFGAFLLYAAWTQVRGGSTGESESEYSENVVLRLTRRVLRTTDDYEGDALVVRRDGVRHVTPMLVVMLAIGTADVLFALDSIPAIFGLTEQTYLVFAANAFSLLGLRQLFFLVDGLLDRLVYLSYGLAAILGFIGIKLVLHALDTNELPFVNGGRQVHVPEIGTWWSLGFIVVVLALTTVLSLRHAGREARATEVEVTGGRG
jgi:tellurite resistance protein TerC